MKKIEKLEQIVEVEFLYEIERNRDKINEIIDILNGQLFEPKILNISPDDAKKWKKQLQKEGLQPHLSQKQPEGKDCINTEPEKVIVDPIDIGFTIKDKDREFPVEWKTKEEVKKMFESERQEEWRERYIERYAQRNKICKKCGHHEFDHYWDGIGCSGFGKCSVDGCHCMYDEKNIEEVVVRESVEDELDFISQLVSERTFTKEELEWILSFIFGEETKSREGIGMEVLKKISKLLRDKSNE